jgi:two-component system sensor histidine kinase MprB
MSRRAAWSERITIRTRVALVAAVAVAVAVALASAASYLAVRRQLLNQIDTSLFQQAHAVQQNPTAAIHNLQQMAGPLQRSGIGENVVFQFVRPDGGIILGDSVQALPVSAADRQVASGQLVDALRTTRSMTHGQVRTLTIGPFQTLDVGPVAIQLAIPLHDVNHTLSNLALVLFLVAASGIVLALVLGLMVARASLRPVGRLTAAAEHVAATQDLGGTIEVTGDDELSRLAIAFNAMLVALAASRRQQAQLVADAGHELRTPLTSLRTNIEVLIKMRDLPEADRSALMADVSAQLEELTTLIGDLVELAREDEQKQEPQDVRLDVVVEKALERARRRAPTLTFDAHIAASMVRGQPALLERAVLNVLDNAAKWSPPGQQVEANLFREGPNWILHVRDHGPGISPDDLPHVFDRFYRAAAAR